MRFEVIVSLKKEVLDAEGRAIRESMNRLGFKSVKEIKVNKRFEIEINSNEIDPERIVQQIGREFLANEVSEEFSVRKLT